ncbi:MAG: carbamoyltransferase HypF [Caldilinea sp. CFX5]|nr:carbamoyltransferase HypF [Caldilinea sp. CFX5]
MQRHALRVTGVVQGVGFRPFVYGLAIQLGLTGFVGNDSAGVFIEIEGDASTLATFHQMLVTTLPPLAHIEVVTVNAIPPTGATAFVIVESQANHSQRTFISPDVALCEDCLRELFDPQDRRYRYPFINCTNCGPRFTIIRNLPYDRPFTTMADFALCPACRHEYENPLDRRFHAQPVACPVCGPQIEFYTDTRHETRITNHESRITGEAALQAAQALLHDGGIVAVKGVGGFHLACDATNDQAVQTVRQRKGRVDKPFAVMVRDVATAQHLAEINTDELALLTSRERPIVLLRKREDSPLSPLVAPGNPYVGLMLPYTPLHYLLFNELEAGTNHTALVMTSGNYSNEPIVKDNAEALTKLAELTDGFLLHNRDIHVPCDDSVIRVFAGHELPIRRSRGYAPFPVRLPVEVRPTLGVGGELKNTFCLAAGHAAFMSQHIGDMENLETLQAFTPAVDHFQTIFDIQPELLVCDLHPAYLSSQWARGQTGKRRLAQVQHHHAHLAGLMAEHRLDGHEPVIGFCFDGTGYGTDGAIWGGELLLADYASFRRRSYLRYIPLPGGDAAVKHPSRTALAHLWAAGVEWDEALPPVAATTQTERRIFQRQFATGFNTVPTSSMGRLFDAVAALAGVRQTATYEAQAAIEFEALAVEAADMPYRFDVAPDGQIFDAAPVVKAVAADLLQGVPVGEIAIKFHQAVADLILQLSLVVRQEEKLNTVALSGGVFQNVLLLRLAVARLEAAGFQVLTHRLTPPNDGGLALGQVLVANAQEGK